MAGIALCLIVLLSLVASCATMQFSFMYLFVHCFLWSGTGCKLLREDWHHWQLPLDAPERLVCALAQVSLQSLPFPPLADISADTCRQRRTRPPLVAAIFSFRADTSRRSEPLVAAFFRFAPWSGNSWLLSVLADKQQDYNSVLLHIFKDSLGSPRWREVCERER